MNNISPGQKGIAEETRNTNVIEDVLTKHTG